jgi:hypothetical protein
VTAGATAPSRRRPAHVISPFKLMRNAPLRYRGEADAILEPARSKPTHVDQGGHPVFSLDQIAGKFVVAVEAFVGQRINPEALYRGEVHPIRQAGSMSPPIEVAYHRRSQ